MKNQTLDGIIKSKIKKTSLPKLDTRIVKRLSVDGVSAKYRIVERRPLLLVEPLYVTPSLIVQNIQVSSDPRTRHFNYRDFLKTNPLTIIMTCALFVSFGLGIWSAASTPKSEAEDIAAVTETAQDMEKEALIVGPIPLGEVAGASTSATEVTNDTLFNTPLVLLKQYFESSVAANKLADRTAKLQMFLHSRKFPLEEQAETIAKQEHWKLILAIGFAESTMGKNCPDNNCSGIGVKPGHPLWRKYATRDEWAVDLNKLLEKRYKDKTLEQMCGVYVQPCNPNWLLATKQILTALDEQGIE